MGNSGEQKRRMQIIWKLFTAIRIKMLINLSQLHIKADLELDGPPCGSLSH